MNKQIRQEIFERFRAANPHPTTELSFSSPFELLIAVLLSAQATDVGVNKATAKLFPVANTPQAMLDLGLDGVMEYTKTIGLYKTKSKHIMQTAVFCWRNTTAKCLPTERLWNLARCRPENCQRGIEYCIRATCYGGRYPYFPCGQPHQNRARQGCARS